MIDVLPCSSRKMITIQSRNTVHKGWTSPNDFELPFLQEPRLRNPLILFLWARVAGWVRGRRLLVLPTGLPCLQTRVLHQTPPLNASISLGSLNWLKLLSAYARFPSRLVGFEGTTSPRTKPILPEPVPSPNLTGRALLQLENPQTVMIVSKVQDNTLVQLTRHLAVWLATTPQPHAERGFIV